MGAEEGIEGVGIGEEGSGEGKGDGGAAGGGSSLGSRQPISRLTKQQTMIFFHLLYNFMA